MLHDVTVRWTRAIGYGQPIDRWFARVGQPQETEGFAQIERVDGEWWLIVFPAWSVKGHPGLKTQKVRYLHAKTAKRHFEAWARVNWLAIEKRFGSYKPPIAEAGRDALDAAGAAQVNRITHANGGPHPSSSNGAGGREYGC